MRELETTLQRFAEYILKSRPTTERAASYVVRWVRRFLARPASNEPLGDQVRRFCEDLETGGACQDWQIRQAEQALRTYFVNFLQRTDWHRRQDDALAETCGGVDPLAVLEQLRLRLRTRHYSWRTGPASPAERSHAGEP